MFLCILFLNEGLVASVNLHVRHNSWLSNGILLFYVSLSAGILTMAAKRRMRDGAEEEAAQKNVMKRLSSELARADEKLRRLQTTKTRVIAIGNKNTQERDLAHIEAIR